MFLPRKRLPHHHAAGRGTQHLTFEKSEAQDKIFTWPDLVFSELICMVILTVLLTVWSILLQAPLEEPANTAVAPNPSKAPWYFLGLQEMLVYFDPWMADTVQHPDSLLCAALCRHSLRCCLPDRRPLLARASRRRNLRASLG